MATDFEIEQLFQSLASRITSLQARSGYFTTDGNLGCLLMLIPIIVLFGYMDFSEQLHAEMSWLSQPLGWTACVVVAAICFIVGRKSWGRWASHTSNLERETDELVVRPLVELLLPGAAFSRPIIVTSGWHPSLLIPEAEGASAVAQGEIEGRLLGQTILLSEAHSPPSWIIRVELPFAVSRHLRIGRRSQFGPFAFWTKGFEQDVAASKRLGAGLVVDTAPLGTGAEEGTVTVPTSAIPPERLFSDELFEYLRAHPDFMMAVVDRTLWVVMPIATQVLRVRVADAAELNSWKQSALAMRSVEGLIQAILAAGTQRAE